MYRAVLYRVLKTVCPMMVRGLTLRSHKRLLHDQGLGRCQEETCKHVDVRLHADIRVSECLSLKESVPHTYKEQ
jgi:ArsR family metal-binding transcriptional regulator